MQQKKTCKFNVDFCVYLVLKKNSFLSGISIIYLEKAMCLRMAYSTESLLPPFFCLMKSFFDDSLPWPTFYIFIDLSGC